MELHFCIGPIGPISRAASDHSWLTTGASSSRIDSGAGLNAKLATHATTKVIRLPKSTYHVHAILVAKKTYNIAAILASIPINAGGWLTLRKNVPTKNTPSTGPLISEAIESAWLNAEPAWLRAISATPICTIPQIKVSTCDTFK